MFVHVARYFSGNALIHFGGHKRCKLTRNGYFNQKVFFERLLGAYAMFTIMFLPWFQSLRRTPPRLPKKLESIEAESSTNNGNRKDRETHREEKIKERFGNSSFTLRAYFALKCKSCPAKQSLSSKPHR